MRLQRYIWVGAKIHNAFNAPFRCIENSSFYGPLLLPVGRSIVLAEET